MNGVLLIAVLLLAPDLPAGVKRIPAPRDAATVAFLDLSRNVPLAEQPYQWYVWDAAGTKESAAAVNFTVNAVCSQASRVVLPAVIDMPGSGKLLRYSLLDLAPQKVHYDRLWGQLQELAAFDPYFHQPGGGVHWVKVTTAPYLASDGKWYTYRWDKVVSKVDFGLHAGGAGPLRLLSALCGGNALPICRADWFAATAWSSVDVNGIRGRYYELAGIEKSRDRNKTDFDLFLENAGADPALVKRLRADQRTVMVSGVTGKWRQVEAFFAAGVRPEDGPSLVTITHDLRDDERAAKRHPLLNLLQFEDQAREVIAAKRNGLHLFLLTDGKGAIQKEAPPDVAAWPGSPHVTKRLTAGISCLECHGGNRGYNPVENYVRDLGRRGFAPLADLSSGENLADVLDRLRGLYDGELNLPLKVAGNGYASAVDKATWGVFGAKSVEGCTGEVYRIYADYFGTGTPRRVMPRQLLRELGYDAPEDKAAEMLAQVVPASREEDGRIGSLRLGLGVLRSDVHEIYYEMALRDALHDAGVDAGPPLKDPARPPAGGASLKPPARKEEPVVQPAQFRVDRGSDGPPPLRKAEGKLPPTPEKPSGGGSSAGPMAAAGVAAAAAVAFRRAPEVPPPQPKPRFPKVASAKPLDDDGYLEIYGPPHAEVTMGISSAGRLDGRGYRWYKLRSVPSGVTWQGYEVRIGQEHVQLAIQRGSRIVVQFSGNKLPKTE